MTLQTTSIVHVNSDDEVKKDTMSPLAYWFIACSQYFPRWFLMQGSVRDQTNRICKVLNNNFSSVVLPFKPISQNPPILGQIEKEPFWQMLKSPWDMYYQKEWDFSMDLKFVHMRADFIQVTKKVLSEKCQKIEPLVKKDGYENMKNVGIDVLIDRLTTEYQELNSTISNAFQTIETKFDEVYEIEKVFLNDEFADNAVWDLHSVTETENAYLQYLEDLKCRKRKMDGEVQEHKHKNKFLEMTKKKQSKEITNESYICQICNGGDTFDQNNIVFCSRCSVTVHQGCYRMTELPKQEWICDLCKELKNQGRYLRCGTCTRRGGVMLKTDCQRSKEFVRSVNPDLFLSRNKKNGKGKKTSPTSHNEDPQNEIGIPRETDRERFQEFYQNLYYNYFREPAEYTSRVFLPVEINAKTFEPVTPNIWVHACCAYWIPCLEFNPDSGLISGYENIDIRRFNITCTICGQSRQ